MTIHRRRNVVQLAHANTPYPSEPQCEALANSRCFEYAVFMNPWLLARGAYAQAEGRPKV